ncbi:MAG: GNAT family N-acetyltransferase [Silicimonas sp.]|nr:GNAT family N-acetyltransferase [Silicimonas sp.]NND17780.1 GNAT family N-acetyltransferase [Silicimonas sp.]NNL74096.1 GNAT family N-acetyltransferase [Silicimonas sp.]
MAGPAVERSDFDSDIYGVEFHRVTVADAGRIAEALERLPDTGLIVDAKVPADDLATIDALVGLGFQKASVLVEFGAAPDPDATTDAGAARVLTLSEADLDAHAGAFRFQRLMQDGRVPRGKTEELMRRWISNSLAGRREVIAIGRNFCTYSVADRRLTIDLLSCLDRGRGIAGRLMRAIHAEASTRGCDEVRVTTEAENVTALRVYQAAGFQPVASWAAMHLVRP